MNLLGGFEFAFPQALWLLLLLPVLAVLRGRQGRLAAVRFSSTAVAREVSGVSRSRAGHFLFALRLFALALLIVGLARPRLGQGQSDVESSGIDIVLAVDVSGSMAALDFSDNRPLTRIDALKVVLEDFIRKRKSDRLGLVTFATQPYLVSPLTLNHDWLLQNLRRIDIGLIDGSRTAIGSALGVAVNRLRDLKDAKSRVVVLLTDGENNAGRISPVAAAEAAAAYGVRVYAIAAGKSGRVMVAQTDRAGRVLRDSRGQPVQGGYAETGIDEKTLQEVARLTNGRFFRAEDAGSLARIYDEIDRLERTEVKLRHYTNYTELFWVPAVLALTLLGLEQLLANTRYRRLP